MRAGKAGAIVLMVIAALWAAMPVLACVQAAPAYHSCCGLMRGCHSPKAMNGKSCCIARPQAEFVAPGKLSADDGAVSLTATSIALELDPLLTSPTVAAIPSQNSPPGQSPGAPFILRI